MITASNNSAAGLATSGLSLVVQSGLKVRIDLVLVPEGDPLLKTDAARGLPFELRYPDRVLGSDAFRATSLYSNDDTVIMTCAAQDIEARITWSKAHGNAISMKVQLRTTSSASVQDGTLYMTVLDNLHPGPLEDCPAHGTGAGPLASDGRPLIRAGTYRLPMWWSSESAGVAVIERYAPELWSPAEWQHVRRDFPVRVRNEWTTCSELTLMPCTPGWLGAFVSWREQLRASLDLSEYARPDCAWYREQWVQHFTFLYGREILDHASGRFDIDRLLDDGKRFGGYDGILLWPGYPRLGVDERTQFDFYDDLPGGREGIRQLAARARQRGTRVFIPYLPWDSTPDARHGIPAEAPIELARAVVEMDIDGVFLDTMDTIRPQFRRCIDAVRAGVVFCSEGQPGDEIISTITGSWDQAKHRHSGEVDLLRFLIPEHPSFMISRHAIGEHREQVIARALFNGTGLVVWQDIFGEVLPFTESQTAHLRDTASLLRSYSACFRGSDCLPLIPTIHPEVIANCFIGEGKQAVMTLCNLGASVVSGVLVSWQPPGGEMLRWNRVRSISTTDPSSIEAGGIFSEAPTGDLSPGEIAVFIGK